MNPIASGRNPDTASTYREIYLNSLALEISNQTKNLNANRQFLATGQSGAEPADTRTVTEKYADYDRLKIEVRNKLREITDGIEAEKILNGLSKIETQFLSGQIDFVISDIKPRWKNGIPATAFVPYLRKLMRKYIETQGVDFGLQQPTGGNLPIPTVNNIPTVGYWQQFRNFVQEMMDGRIPRGYQLESGLGANIPRYLLRPLGVNAPVSRINNDMIPREAFGGEPPIRVSFPIPADIRRKIGEMVFMIDSIIDLYPTLYDEETVVASRNVEIISNYEMVSRAVMATIPREAQMRAYEDRLVEAARTGDERFFMETLRDIRQVVFSISLKFLEEMKNLTIRAETDLLERGEELPPNELRGEIVDGFIDADEVGAAPDPYTLAIQDIPDYGAEAEAASRPLQEGELAPGVFSGAPNFQRYPYLQSIQEFADSNGEFPVLPDIPAEERAQFPTPAAFPMLAPDEKRIFFQGAAQHNWDLGDISGDIRDFIANVGPFDPDDLNRMYAEIYEGRFSGAPPPSTPFPRSQVQTGMSPDRRQELREIFRLNYPSVAAFNLLRLDDKFNILENAEQDGFLDDEITKDPRVRARLIAALGDGDIDVDETEVNRWYASLYKIITSKTPAASPAASEGSFSTPIRENPLQRTLSSSTPTSASPSGRGLSSCCMGKPKRGRKSKNIIMGRGLAKISEDNIDWDKGIKPEPSYVPFGKHFINKFRLKDDVLMLRTMKGGTILSVPTQRVSKNLSKVLKKIVGGSTPAFDDLNELNDDDKALLFKMSKTSKVGDSLSVPNPDKLKQEREDRRFEILRGQIMAGQDNKDAIKEFKLLLIKMMNNGRIPKAQAIDILTELTAIGH